jgi:hypothetical protein
MGARRERNWRRGGDGTEWTWECSQRKRDVRGGRRWWRYIGEVDGAPLVEGMIGLGERN